MATTFESKEAQEGPSASPFSQEQNVDEFSYDDAIVRMFVTATIAWGVVATLVGLIVAVLLVAPVQMP